MSDIKKYFKSRWGDAGIIMEADFSQLEVIYLAHLTKDAQLIADILSGLDMHTVRAAELFGIPESRVTPDQRRTAKGFSFMLQYGAGAKHMAERTGHPEIIARAFIDNYYARYPQVAAWQAEVQDAVEKSKEHIPKHTPMGYPMHKGMYVSETGRRYCFFTTDAPEWMRKRKKTTSFKPTEIKNYPIQGGATGDIVPLVLGEVYNWIITSGYVDRVKLVATVHDSIVLDIPKELCYSIGTELRRIMESAPKYYEETFGVKFDLPLKVGISYGPSWGEQTDDL